MADEDVTRAISRNELETALAVGNVVADRYRILAHAGAGSMGIAYRARDLKLERTVALKFQPSEVNASEKDKQNFLKEARIASSLDHPNIGPSTASKPRLMGYLIVRAFYDGPSLAERIRVGGAEVYNQLGETGLALEWMTKAIQTGYSTSRFRDSVVFRNLVDNPRFQEIVGTAQPAH